MTIARGFARHLAGIDGRTEIPPNGRLPMPRMKRRNPYLYSRSDIAALVDRARTILRPPFRAATYESLLAVTGMRVGEAAAGSTRRRPQPRGHHDRRDEIRQTQAASRAHVDGAGADETDLDAATGTLQGQRGPGFAAARTAIMNMAVHLDPAAGRSTSGVRRYLNFAISSLASGQGRALCGNRRDLQFDMAELIRVGGTVYLLAEVDEKETARPLVTLFAQEMFMSAERTARRMPRRRLSQTFMGIFDELHAGVRMPILPYVAAVQRKYGISFAYAVQSSMDEDEMYGRAGAERLRGQCHTIIGGYDAGTASETTRRAGKTTTVTASRSTGGHRSEHPDR